MDLLPLARSSRATLQLCLEAGQACLKEGVEVPTQIRVLAEQSLNLLDLYLTERGGEIQSNRRPGELRELWDYTDVSVLLSDGHSRILLVLCDFMGIPQVVLDYDRSRLKVVDRWEALDVPTLLGS